MDCSRSAFLSFNSLSPRVCSNSRPLSQWCHPTISSSVAPFSSCPQSFSAFHYPSAIPKSIFRLNFFILCCKWSLFLWEEVRSSLVHGLPLPLGKLLSQGTGVGHRDNEVFLTCFFWGTGGRVIRALVFLACQSQGRASAPQMRVGQKGSLTSWLHWLRT